MDHNDVTKVVEFTIGSYKIRVSLTDVNKALEYYDLIWTGEKYDDSYYIEYHVTDKNTYKTIEYKVLMGKEFEGKLEQFGNIDRLFEYAVNMLKEKYSKIVSEENI